MPLPLLPLIGAGVGLVQSILGGNKAKKAQKQLEGMQVPEYGGSDSIMDYYNKALQRFNTNPYQSQQNQYAQQQADRSQSAGLNSLQSRRSAVGGISRLSALRNDASLKAGAMAEQQQMQNMGMLGEATGMKTADELRQFQQNKIAPYEKQYNLLSMKAGAGNEQANAGMSNIFGGLGAAQDTMNINKIYGKSK
jgi:hypothetical protein